MTPPCRVFNSDVTTIENFLEQYDTTNDGAGTTPPATILQYRRILYAGYVVSLYGAFENYVEAIVEWTVDRFVEADAAGENQRLLALLLKEHYKRALECLSRPGDPRYGLARSREDLLEEMKSSSRKQLSGIRGDVFRVHANNFRLNTIRKFLRPVGIDLNSEVLSRVFATDDKRTTELDHNVEHALKTLVSARNEAAHGKLINLFGAEYLRDWLSKVRTLVSAIDRSALSLIVESILPTLNCHEVSVDEIYQKGYVAVVSTNSSRTVTCGDVLVSRKCSWPAFFWAKIESIRVNDTCVNFAELDSTKSVGLRTNSKRQKNEKHWVAPAAVWANANLPDYVNRDY